MIEIKSIEANTVSVLIGANGSGKSRLLRELSCEFLKSGRDVIAIAPTIYDRFRRMPGKGFRFFGARQGPAAAAAIVRHALERAGEGQLQVVKNLTQALEHTCFEPVIGLEVRDLDLKRFKDSLDEHVERLEEWRSDPENIGIPPSSSGVGHLRRDEREALFSALVKWIKQNGESGVVRLRLDAHSFSELDALSFCKIAQHERLLLRTKTVSKIGYHLFRERQAIPLLQACSGEICFISTIAFISTQIKRGAVIAIDEPDTSLHPTWQQNYIKILLDLFHRYEPRVLISTHSPIIVSGAEVAKCSIAVYEMTGGVARRFDHSKISLEEMYERLFGLVTPNNHYLSQRAVSMLNSLNSGEMNLDQVIASLEDLRSKSYDELQQSVIVKFQEMARKLALVKRRQ